MSAALQLPLRVIRYPSGAVGVILLIGCAILAATATNLFPDGPWEIAGRPFLW